MTGENQNSKNFIQPRPVVFVFFFTFSNFKAKEK